ncbi:MAG: NUDIX hydrolase [Candidatus Magasanikbacteria bacterium]|nr:NUDIX hydrolase [Candidatus Magasanikbacteria bacterium]
MSWKIIEKKDVSPSKWRKVENWKVQTHKNTIEDEVYISLLGDSVVVCGLTDDNKILLLTQYCIGQQEYLKTFVAGFVDSKSAEETIKHELQEEAGCSAKELIYLGNSHKSKWAIGKAHFYLAKGIEQNLEQKLESLEDISVEFISLEELEKLLDENKIHDIGSTICAEKVLRYLKVNS